MPTISSFLICRRELWDIVFKLANLRLWFVQTWKNNCLQDSIYSSSQSMLNSILIPLFWTPFFLHHAFSSCAEEAGCTTLVIDSSSKWNFFPRDTFSSYSTVFYAKTNSEKGDGARRRVVFSWKRLNTWNMCGG